MSVSQCVHILNENPIKGFPKEFLSVTAIAGLCKCILMEVSFFNKMR